MSRTVWKYELPHATTGVDLPADSRPLHVAAQHGKVCMWVEVDPDAELRKQTFYVVGTGHPLPPDVMPPTYIGSFLTDADGTYVFHVYQSFDQRWSSAVGAP